MTGVLARPAFALYLLALATLGLKWLSPLSSFQENAGWTDVFVALAALAWLAERAVAQSFPRLRLFHLALALWLAAALLSVAFADAKGTGARAELREAFGVLGRRLGVVHDAAPGLQADFAVAQHHAANRQVQVHVGQSE